MLVRFPFRKRKVTAPLRTPDKESTGRFSVSSDKEDESVVTVSDDGSDTEGASAPTGHQVLTSSRKRKHEGSAANEPPAKSPADGEETPPLQEQNRSMETPEAILLRARNELYAKDHRRAKAVRARLLGLDPAVAPTEAQINASPRFALRSAAAERDAPDIITDYWMPYLL